MFDWIPLSSYSAIYYHLMFLLMLISAAHSTSNDLFSPSTKQFSAAMGMFLLLFISLYMGTRPYKGGAFADMGSYARAYNNIRGGGEFIVTKEYVFNYFMIYAAKIMDARSFFFLCSLIYTIPCYIFSRKFAGSYWYFTFFIFVASFMFWPFGTNGIRNGLATSIFILALCYYERKAVMYPLMIFSIGIHSSVIIPIAAFLFSGLYKNPKAYFYIWLAAIPLSLLGGSFWEGLFANLGFGDDNRAEDYLTKGNAYGDNFSSTGFRWDFLLYSAMAVFAGWYFIIKRKVKDRFYVHLWGTYMIANAFWILVIRANFSNRFAYLSWFLMAPVIAYPLLRYKLFPHQYKVVGAVISFYYLFTYFMFLKG